MVTKMKNLFGIIVVLNVSRMKSYKHLPENIPMNSIKLTSEETCIGLCCHQHPPNEFRSIVCLI